MQIPENPFRLLGPGFLQQPQPGTRQQVSPDLQTKAAAVQPARTAAKGGAAKARPPVPPALASARNLEEAVNTLSAEGRLPARGSLIDLRA
ncbi:MAG: hypothetical protein ACE5DS_01925 [Kiloniellaceae bacterium]